MIESILDAQLDRQAAAACLRRIAARALSLATRSVRDISATPLSLATPGSLNRYLETFAAKSVHCAQRKAWAFRAERLANELLYQGGAAASTTGDRWIAAAYRRAHRAPRPTTRTNGAR